LPRVQAVGPEHFGIVAIDCAKATSHFLLADFYGKLILEPAPLPHSRGAFQAAIERIRQAMAAHDLRDVVVSIEQTGEYHRPVQRAFRSAGFDTRLVHPLASKQFRQPAHPDDKTDPNDAGGVFRATTQGFGLSDPLWPADYVRLRLLRRHRRDLVDKNVKLHCQIREVLHAAMPGYAECFGHLWDDSPAALALARHVTSAQAVLQAGLAGLQQVAAQAGFRCRRDTLHKILAWAEQAPPGHSHPAELQRILVALDDDRLRKNQEILELERALAHLAVGTPYALLLAIPGINLVTVADLAGELGPLEFYPGPNAITGRAGLAPSRYQSDRVDRPNGPLRRRGHRRLRAVLMQTADNLVHCNHHCQARAALWQRQGKDPRWVRVKIAKSFSRLAFAIVAGRQLFPHPCLQPEHYVLSKLLAFHGEHRTPPADVRRDLETLTDLIPARRRAAEAKPLQEQLDDLAQRRRGPQPLAEILPFVLARLGLPTVQSQEGAGP
jgi:transposase